MLWDVISQHFLRPFTLHGARSLALHICSESLAQLCFLLKTPTARLATFSLLQVLCGPPLHCWDLKHAHTEVLQGFQKLIKAGNYAEYREKEEKPAVGLQSRGARDRNGRLVKIKAGMGRDGGDQKKLRTGGSITTSGLCCSGFNYLANPPVTFPSLSFRTLGFLSC